MLDAITVVGGRRVIDRPRVQRALARSMAAQITILLGPAGCGKSIAIAGCPHLSTAIHYRVGSARSTFVRFVRGLSRVVCAVSRGAETSFARAWERSLQAHSPEEALARWMCDHLAPSDRVVVFDDLHEATQNPSIAAFIAKFAELRAPYRVVMTARAPGSLPIALWMATGVMRRPLDATSLRFDRDDVLALAAFDGSPIAPERAAAIVERTGGLPVAVRYALANVAQSPADARRERLGSYADIAAAIFARRSPEERAFLLTSCVFPVARPELLAATGWPDIPSRRRAAGADAAFIWDDESPQDGRLQHCFRDYLAAHLAASEDDDRVSLTLQVVRALERAGHVADALTVAAKYRLPQALARIIDAHGFAILESGQIDVISEAVPLSGGPTGAVATALRGFLEAALGRLDTSEAWFTLGLGTARTTASRVTIALYYARELIQRRRPDAYSILEPYADAVDLPRTLQLDVRSSYAQALVIAGRVDEASRRTDDVVAMLDATASAAATARVLGRAAYVAFESGDVETARDRALAAASLAVDEALYDVATSAYSVLYGIAYDHDDDAIAALHYLDLLTDVGGKAGTVRADIYGAIAMYDLHAEAGNQVELGRIDAVIDRLDMHYATPEVTEGLLPARAMQAGWHGEFRRAYEMLRPTVDHQASAERRALRWAEIGLYAAAAGDRAAAVRGVETSLESIDDTTDASIRRELTVILASLALWVLGESARAGLCLAKSSSRVQRAPRIRALHATVSCIIEHAGDAKQRTAALLMLLAELRRVAFGGFATLIEALPGDAWGFRETLGEVIARGERRPHANRSVLVPEAMRSASDGPHHPGARTAEQPQVDAIDVFIDRFIAELDHTAPLTAEHSRAVSAWCARIARKLGLDAGDVIYLARCGLIHDVGKLMTPSAILEAPRRLTMAEWTVMQKHPGDGAQIVSTVPSLRQFVPIVRYHHERIDGRGYPDGLRTSAIPLAARIVTVADSFNAMIGRRPYRLPMAPTEALEELHSNSHSQFDPEIVDAMTRIVMARTLDD